MSDSTDETIFSVGPVPAKAASHDHVCPCCDRSLTLRRSESEASSDHITIASRKRHDVDGEILEVARVRLPGLCWCGAPLPGDEKVFFTHSLVQRNMLTAQRILEQLRKERAAKRAIMQTTRGLRA